MAPVARSSRGRGKNRGAHSFGSFITLKHFLDYQISQVHTNTTQGTCHTVCVAQTCPCMGEEIQLLCPQPFLLFPHSLSWLLQWNTQGTESSQLHRLLKKLPRNMGESWTVVLVFCFFRCIFSCEETYMKYRITGQTSGQGDLGVHINCQT